MIVNQRATYDIACSLLFSFSRQPNLCHFESACQHGAPRYKAATTPWSSLTAPRQRDSVGHLGEEKRMSTGELPFIAIPVFPSRVFRHGYFFVNTDKGIKSPADLKGNRGGVPEYTMTAAVYMRGLLQHEHGVKPSDVEWVQGRAERLGRERPGDIRLTQAPPGAELGDLLERGEIDFMMTANNPLAFRRGSPKVRRLFPNYPEVEKDYYRRTKIYPIMHTVVIRNDVYQRDPW